jgi:biopolymer transport protein ExbD
MLQNASLHSLHPLMDIHLVLLAVTMADITVVAGETTVVFFF